MPSHSCILSWKIPWTEEPGRLQSMGSRKSQIPLSNSTTNLHDGGVGDRLRTQHPELSDHLRDVVLPITLQIPSVVPFLRPIPSCGGCYCCCCCCCYRQIVETYCRDVFNYFIQLKTSHNGNSENANLSED